VQRCPGRLIYIPLLKKTSWDMVWASKILLLKLISFHRLCKFGHKMQTHTPIRLKASQYRVSPIICIKRSQCLSCLKGKPLEGFIWNLAYRLSNHHRSACRSFEKNRDKNHGDMSQIQTCFKITWSNLWKNLFCSYNTIA